MASYNMDETESSLETSGKLMLTQFLHVTNSGPNDILMVM